jgi:phosphate transport system substrate-binding protein
MNRRFLQLLMAPALVAGLVTVGTAGADAAVSHAKKLPSATLNGSGSTFQLAFDQAAIQEFTTLQPNITINYSGGGSGKGRQDFADSVVQFAGTDAPYPAATASAPSTAPKNPFFYFPTIVGPITVSYNLSGVSKLQLSGATIAKIFSRQIKTWNDPAIAADNPKVKLPSTAITVARRSDSSGTTQNFTTFLTKAAPTDWTLGAASTINWPADTQGGTGNSGVAQIVKSTDGAVGYVDYSDAKAAGLTFAAVANASNKFIRPTPAGASLAASKAVVNPDLTYNPIYAPGLKSYPITSPTWIIVYQAQSDAAQGKALKAFLTYILTAGQKLAPTVDFAPLPPQLTKKALAQVKKIG